MNKKGSLVNVGLGMTLGAHITPVSRNYIEQADVVFVAASNQLVEEWVKTMNDQVVSLQGLYEAGKSRKQTYAEMNELIMASVRKGKQVCGAFYGHPGVFALTPHQTIKMARAEGYKAHMEPGISAHDCLYADLGVDPATFGIAHYEANHFLFNDLSFDANAYLVLWQVCLVGDKTLTVFETEASVRQQLVDVLIKYYPLDHEVILYESAVLPIENFRNDCIPLADLAKQVINMKTTLVVPPLKQKKSKV